MLLKRGRASVTLADGGTGESRGKLTVVINSLMGRGLGEKAPGFLETRDLLSIYSEQAEASLDATQYTLHICQQLAWHAHATKEGYA